VHPNQITDWKSQLMERSAQVFGDASDKAGGGSEDAARQNRATDLGERFFRKRAHQGERKEMIDRTHDLPVTRQCQILKLARSTAYYTPQPVSDSDLQLMRRIDELHLEYPFAGSRMLRDMLRREGRQIGRKHVRTLMKKMDIEALYRKPNTSQRHAAHPIYPYLLRNLKIERSNQVWATDITYIPMRRGFIYLVAVLDWHSRRVLSWRVSNTLTTDFCLDAVREAITRYGTPDIFNTDQGSQFTSSEFTGLVKEHGIQISMDGKGCWRDNVFVERLWKSVKYEEVYLKAYDSVSAAKAGLGNYLAFYNTRRPHQSLDGKTPDTIYFAGLPQERIAA
jgi:putative transposase